MLRIIIQTDDASMAANVGGMTYRRYKCTECKGRWTTLETLVVNETESGTGESLIAMLRNEAIEQAIEQMKRLIRRPA